MKFKCIYKERIKYENRYQIIFKEVADTYQTNVNLINLMVKEEQNYIIGNIYELKMEEVK